MRLKKKPCKLVYKNKKKIIDVKRDINVKYGDK